MSRRKNEQIGPCRIQVEPEDRCFLQEGNDYPTGESLSNGDARDDLEVREPIFSDLIPISQPMGDDEPLCCPLCNESEMVVLKKQLWCAGECGLLLTNVFSNHRRKFRRSDYA